MSYNNRLNTEEVCAVGGCCGDLTLLSKQGQTLQKIFMIYLQATHSSEETERTAALITAISSQ